MHCIGKIILFLAEFTEEDKLYMTLLKEHIAFDNFEVINNTKATNFTGAKTENGCISTPTDESPANANANTITYINSCPRINQYVHVLDTPA